MKSDTLIDRAFGILKKEGLLQLLRKSLVFIYVKFLVFIYVYRRPLRYKSFKSSGAFRLQKDTYNYFYHKYNSTWNNERAVEVPIILRMVEKYHGQKILEVGNVLSHYFSINHDICDKYEKADGVINQDIIDFQPTKKYDLIVSISTLEHVGWDENPREPMKVLQAIEHLKEIIAPKGKLVVTLPLGQNPVMDELLKKGEIQFTKMYFLKRVSLGNKWVEADWNDICDVKYGYPFSMANGLVIGIIEKSEEALHSPHVLSLQ